MHGFSKLKHFLARPYWMQLAFVPVWCLLGLARLQVLHRDFKLIAPTLGHHQGVARPIPELSSHEMQRARQISRQIQWVARYCPWRANCFAQAITARWLCGFYRLPCLICFGLKKSTDGQVLAHAWVRAGDVAITGGDGFADYQLVASFLYSPKTKAA